MEIIQTIITSFASILTLFVLTKLMGNRQMSQLSMFDYINGITIGSIAAEMATTEFTDSIKPFIAMIIYALVVLSLAIIANKSIALRRIIDGKTIVLYDKGTLYYKNFAKAKLDINEFLVQCRVNGYFDLSNIQTALLETNGKISFLPVSDQRPVTGNDLSINPEQEMLVANVILDGKIMEKNLKHTGNDKIWLEKQLQANDIKDPSDVFLATCDINNKICVYRKIKDKMNIDVIG